ncbi:type II toxin-antitoxin system RelE/ParE family toxin [Marinobacter psychrophilus]|nr:type II toxin-antitoxin system RelE/ParE family toxin [Marinobacter psychrophilus]
MARVIFTMSKGDMVLLNGFIKKTQKIPAQELEKARDRKKNLV